MKNLSYFFFKNIVSLNINRRIFLCFIYRISINLSSFTDRDWNETFYRNNYTDPQNSKIKKIH